MYSSKGFNSNSMDFVGYEIRDKLLWTSGKRCSNTNTISKQGIPKRNMNMTSTSTLKALVVTIISTLVISC